MHPLFSRFPLVSSLDSPIIAKNLNLTLTGLTLTLGLTGVPQKLRSYPSTISRPFDYSR